jgi:predicted TIM-barrel enzyme
VLESDLSTVSATSTGVKLIRVQVVYNGTLLAEESIIRTSAWDEMRSGK